MNKLAAARHKAEEKREAAEANRNHQAAKTEEKSKQIIYEELVMSLPHIYHFLAAIGALKQKPILFNV